MVDDRTTLPEELLLIALEDTGGRLRATSAFPAGLAAALLVELVLAGRLRLQDGVLSVSNPAPLGDALLDDALAGAGEWSPRKPADALTRIAGRLKPLGERVAAGLVQRRVLRHHAARVLGIFPVHRYPIRERNAKRDCLERLRRVVSGSLAADDRTCALGALVGTCHLQRFAFEERNTAEVGARLHEYTKPEAYRREHREALAAILSSLASKVSS